VNAYFTPVKIKTTVNEIYHTARGDVSVRDLVVAHSIRGVPTVNFLKSDGSVLFSVPGYLPANKFATVLKYVGERHFQDKTFEEYLKSLEKTS